MKLSNMMQSIRYLEKSVLHGRDGESFPAGVEEVHQYLQSTVEPLKEPRLLLWMEKRQSFLSNSSSKEEGLREDGWTEWGIISKRRNCQGRKCMTVLHRPHIKVGIIRMKRKKNYTTSRATRYDTALYLRLPLSPAPLTLPPRPRPR